MEYRTYCVCCGKGLVIRGAYIGYFAQAFCEECGFESEFCEENCEGRKQMVKAYYRETDPNTGKAKWVVIKGLRVSRNGTYVELGYDLIEKGGAPSKFFWKEDFSNTGNAFGMGYFVYKLTKKDGDNSIKVGRLL